jgi:hypothetical protein
MWETGRLGSAHHGRQAFNGVFKFRVGMSSAQQFEQVLA